MCPAGEVDGRSLLSVVSIVICGSTLSDGDMVPNPQLIMLYYAAGSPLQCQHPGDAFWLFPDPQPHVLLHWFFFKHI